MRIEVSCFIALLFIAPSMSAQRDGPSLGSTSSIRAVRESADGGLAAAHNSAPASLPDRPITKLSEKPCNRSRSICQELSSRPEPDAPRAKFTEETRGTAARLKVRIKAEREPRVADKRYWLAVGAVAAAGGPWDSNFRHAYLDCIQVPGQSKCKVVGGGGYTVSWILRDGLSTLIAGLWMHSLKNDEMMTNGGRSRWKWILPGVGAVALNLRWDAWQEHRCKQGTVRLPNGKCP